MSFVSIHPEALSAAAGTSHGIAQAVAATESANPIPAG
jgi:hypothetical protein